VQKLRATAFSDAGSENSLYLDVSITQRYSAP